MVCVPGYSRKQLFYSSTPKLELYPVGCPDELRYITSTRGPVPISSGTDTRVMEVTGQCTVLLTGIKADMHADKGDKNRNMKEQNF